MICGQLLLLRILPQETTLDSLLYCAAGGTGTWGWRVQAQLSCSPFSGVLKQDKMQSKPLARYLFKLGIVAFFFF